MKYFETKLTLFFKKEIPYQQMNEILSKNISLVMLNDAKLKEIHGQSRGFKPYHFGLPYPVDTQTKLYKKSKPYTFHIRSVDRVFLSALTKELYEHNGLDFKVLGYEFKEVKQKFIDKISTISSAILTMPTDIAKNRYWIASDGDIEMVMKRIVANLEKKHKQFFGEQLTAPADCINYLEITNKVPIAIKYKRVTFLTNKFTIGFNSDEVSQKLAFVAMGCGLLEKGTHGFGYCLREVR